MKHAAIPRKRGLWTGALLLAGASVLAAQEERKPEAESRDVRENLRKVTFVDHEGNVLDAVTARDARIHFAGGAAIASADYFRGDFDGVRERAGDLSYRSHGSLIIEPWEDEGGWRGGLSFTIGMQNAGSNNVTPGEDALPGFATTDIEHWYESDIYAGLTARVLEDWVLGATYTAYTSPAGSSAKREEAALSLVYEGEGTLGELNLHGKVAVPLAERDGLYLEAGIAPTLRLLEAIRLPLDLRGIAVAGFGSNDYYRDGSRRTGYLRLGVATTIPLGQPSEAYGTWTLDAQADYYIRDDDLRDLATVPGENDTGVFIATVGIRLVF